MENELKNPGDNIMVPARKSFSGISLAFALIALVLTAGNAFAQEPPVGEQNGETWNALDVGTPASTVARKTFYVDGMYDMSVFWSQHADLKEGAVDYNDAFIGMDVAQIRDGLDSFYVHQKNIFVPIIDAILVIRLQNAQIGQSKIDQVIREFRTATINGPDPEKENEIWKATLPLLR